MLQRQWILAVLMLLVVPIEAQRVQQPSILIGTIELSLGMTVDAVGARLGDRYRFERETGFVWSVGGPPFVVAGTLKFDNKGRLESASRNWEPEDQQSGVPTTDALFNALSQITGSASSGLRTCRCAIGLSEHVQPEGGSRTISITDGVRTISVETVRVNARAGVRSTSAVVITENIGK